MKQYDLIVAGGGAAGFFAAINAAALNHSLSVLLLEKGNQFLGKVKVSGGGRCNVTHACFEPAELVKFYPRGSRELLGPFHTFQPGDTFEWFQSRGVELKIEDDNRVFPESDNSQTIIDCFLEEAKKRGVRIQLQTAIESFEKVGDQWKITTNREELSCKHLVIATGSSLQLWKQLESLNISIVPPVPSLFTFNCKHPVIEGLPGISFPNAEVTIPAAKLDASGPLLITHWGFSGPAILKLSAWGARELAEKQYRFKMEIDFYPQQSFEECLDELKALRLEHPKKKVGSNPQFGLPAKFWLSLCTFCRVADKNWADTTNADFQQLSAAIHRLSIDVNGKSTFKEEFVTCGGVDLKHIDFKTMQHKAHPGLYFCGEVLNIDAITGGFNFQAAWTTAFIAASQVANS